MKLPRVDNQDQPGILKWTQGSHNQSVLKELDTPVAPKFLRIFKLENEDVDDLRCYITCNIAPCPTMCSSAGGRNLRSLKVCKVQETEANFAAGISS